MLAPRVVHASFIRFKNPLGRAAWALAAPIHVRVIPYLLTRAARDAAPARTTRLPSAEHTSRPLRIHELAADFRLEDVWALPTPGGASDFPALVQMLAGRDPARGSPGASRVLWSIRLKLGKLLGWDDPHAGLGSRVPTLRDRLPEDLREGSPGPDSPTLPFTSLYVTDDEWASEIANKTVHAIMHIAWVPDGAGRYRGQMAVYVKPNGALGNLYMLAIRPFRHLIVYPAMLRQIERRWRARADGASRTPA